MRVLWQRARFRGICVLERMSVTKNLARQSALLAAGDVTGQTASPAALMMFITPTRTTHTPSGSCPRPHAHVSWVRWCGAVSSGNPAVQGLHAICKGWGGCRCFRITMEGCLTQVSAKKARVVVSKVEEPEEEEEKCSEEKIRFLGHQRPTARLHQQVLVVQWKKRPDLAEQQQRRQQQNRRLKILCRWSR